MQDGLEVQSLSLCLCVELCVLKYIAIVQQINSTNLPLSSIVTSHERQGKMSTKITSARIEELESLQKRKDYLQEKIQEKKDKMKEIRNAMEDGDTADIMVSSSTAALRKRGKEPSTLTNEDLLEALDIAIDRLEEEKSEVDEELKNLKDLVNSA